MFPTAGGEGGREEGERGKGRWDGGKDRGEGWVGGVLEQEEVREREREGKKKVER